LRAWKKQARYFKITNSKAIGWMKEWRLTLSVIQLPRIAARPVQGVNSAWGSVLESKEHQQLVGAAC